MPRVACILLMLSSTLSGFAQKDRSENVESAVEQVLNAQVQAWNHHDLGTFMRGYWNSPELTFFSGDQVFRGWGQALERYRKRYQGEGREMGTLSFRNLNVDPLAPTAAVVRGEWHLAMSDGKTPHGLFTLIFRKFPQGWKIIHDHTSTAQ